MPVKPRSSAERPPFAGPWVHDLAGILARVVLAGAHAGGLTDLRPAYLPVIRSMGQSPRRIGEIAELARVSKASLVYLVNDLEKLGYVRREPDPSDGRGTLVALTSKGAQVQAAGRNAVSRLHDHWEQSIPPEDIARFSATLVRLVELSRDWEPPGGSPDMPAHRGRRRPDQ